MSIPPQIETLLQGFVEQSKEILQDNLVGIYLHGSLVMGCFNPQKSDVDLIIVVNCPLSDPIKRAYMDMVVTLNALAPEKGLELSVALREVCDPFIYPTPFELHFSISHLDAYQRDPADFIAKMKGLDKDLAAHFTILTHRGQGLYGPPIDQVFAEVPAGDYMDAIWYDVSGAPDHIADDPMYLILNLARVLAYKEEGLILSKKEGGDWALRHLPQEFHPLIEDALREYTEGARIAYDETLARRYASDVIRQIGFNK